MPGAEIRTVVRKHNVIEQTFFRWRYKRGGLEVSEARRLTLLESENAKLKKLAAEQLLVIEGLKEFSRGSRRRLFYFSPARCAATSVV